MDYGQIKRSNTIQARKESLTSYFFSAISLFMFIHDRKAAEAVSEIWIMGCILWKMRKYIRWIFQKCIICL